ncbi:MAG: lipoyl synthase [Myxococcota bacterium]
MNEKKNSLKKPHWLKISLGGGENFADIKGRLAQYKLVTVCEEALCPNRGECWSARSLTVMLMGDVCSRSCAFCNVVAGKPRPLNKNEPKAVAEMIASLELRHIVLTCVTRDDLDDGGALHWAETIGWIRKFAPETSIEALVSDFGGSEPAQDIVIAAKPDVFAHNIETVKSLQPIARCKANYETSLKLLNRAKNAGLLTKSGLMVGLGETDHEVRAALDDLAKTGVTIVTIGQYLQPSKEHLPVSRYVPPEMFEEYKRWGKESGIRLVISAPLVRSSYLAHAYLALNGDM